MTMPLHVAGRTDVGQERQENEDSLRTERLPDGSHLLIVCDGMGGHQAGALASRTAAQAIVDHVWSATAGDPRQVLYDALTAANEAVVLVSLREGADGAGTTAVCAWVRGDRAWVAWAGDSRLYLVRDGRIVFRTQDHSRVQEMVNRGILSPEAARVHPEAHILTMVLGGAGHLSMPFKPAVDDAPLLLQPGDVLMLFSDGLYDDIHDRELLELIRDRGYEEAAQRLVDEANRRGGHDNISVVLAVAAQERIPPWEVREPLPPPPAPPPAAIPPPPETVPGSVAPEAPREGGTFEAEELPPDRRSTLSIRLPSLLIGFLAGIACTLLALTLLAGTEQVTAGGPAPLQPAPPPPAIRGAAAPAAVPQAPAADEEGAEGGEGAAAEGSEEATGEAEAAAAPGKGEGGEAGE